MKRSLVPKTAIAATNQSRPTERPSCLPHHQRPHPSDRACKWAYRNSNTFFSTLDHLTLKKVARLWLAARRQFGLQWLSRFAFQLLSALHRLLIDERLLFLLLPCRYSNGVSASRELLLVASSECYIPQTMSAESRRYHAAVFDASDTRDYSGRPYTIEGVTLETKDAEAVGLSNMWSHADIIPTKHYCKLDIPPGELIGLFTSICLH